MILPDVGACGEPGCRPVGAGSVADVVSAPSEWVSQVDAARILGVHRSAVPKMVRRGDLSPRHERPNLKRSDVEALRDARAERSRLLSLPPEPKPAPQPPDEHPDWVLAKDLATEMGVGGAWVVHQRARRGRLPYVTAADGTRWFRRDLVAMAVQAQEATRSKEVPQVHRGVGS